MLASYTKGLNKEDAKEVESEFKAAVRYREYNIKILEDYIQKEQDAMLIDEKFDPNAQLLRIASIKAYKRVIKLMS